VLFVDDIVAYVTIEIIYIYIYIYIYISFEISYYSGYFILNHLVIL
jgi:hypothetical protein